MSEIKLTPKQEKFANLYVELGNASEAYRQSYSCEKMSDSTIWENASRLTNDRKVSARIKQLQSETQKRADISKDEAVCELANIVRGRLTNVFDFKDGVIVVKNLHELPDSIISCIESIKETSNGVEIKLYSKISAIDRLSKMLGWDEATKMDIDATLGVKPISKDVAKKMIDELE